MTEEDTFNLLRRTPRSDVDAEVRAAFKKIQFTKFTVPEWMELRKQILNRNGWSERGYIGYE